MTNKELILEGTELLRNSGIAEAELDARLLFEEAFDVSRSFILMNAREEVLDVDKCDKFRDFIAQRSKRIPLQHITSHQDFMGLRFKVNEHVLIPRQDTEILVEEAMKSVHDGMTILDLCTGSGCILISLLNYSNSTFGTATDISQEALEVAGENAENILGMRTDSSYRFLKADIFDPIPEELRGRFDIVVSNPPYIESKIIDELEPEVSEHDPMIALDGGSDGLKFYRRIGEIMKDILIPGGEFFLEIGYDQGKTVSDIMRNNGFEDIKIIKDYAGLDRVVKGRRKINV